MISPTHTVSPEWQNENALRAYPLEDDAPAASVIPTWLMADLRITADTCYDKLFISSIYVSDVLLSVGISGSVSGEPPVGLLTKTITRDELEPFKAYSMDRITDTASGVIVFGEPPQDAEPCKYAFTAETAAIVPAAIVRSVTPGVTRIIDETYGAEITGIVDLSGNSEFRTYLDSSDTTGRTIVFELTDLYKELTTSVCSSAPEFSTCGQTPVKTINGVPPDDDGTFTLKFR